MRVCNAYGVNSLTTRHFKFAHNLKCSGYFFITMSHKLRKFHRQSIELYEEAFGGKHEEHYYFVRKTNTGVVLITAYLTDSGVYGIHDQVLIVHNKIYRNNELVYEGGKKDG